MLALRDSVKGKSFLRTDDFAIGQRWVSHSDPDLGLGVVTEIAGRTVTLGFPAALEERIYAVDQAPLARILFRVGDTVELEEGGQLTVTDIEDRRGVLIYHGQDESGADIAVSELKLSSNLDFSAPQQRLFAGQFDRNGAFRLRVATLMQFERLAASSGQGLLGARISHLPHQLYIAHEVARRHAPRVLLADEVGLGKTIEAGLILHYQLHTGRAKRVLIVVPEPLLHQWLVEMLRRFNLAFSIVDQKRYELDEGPETLEEALLALDDEPAGENPFLDQQLSLCSLEFLMENEEAREHALAAGWDLLCVDEAHHLAWSPDSPSPEYKMVETLSQQTAGVLLLTATPEQLGVASHFARLRLLDPDRYPDLEKFRAQESDYARINELVRQLPEEGKPDEAAQALLREWLGEELDSLLNRPKPSAAIIDALLDRHGTGRVLFRNTRAAVPGFPGRQVTGEPLEAPELYPPEVLQGIAGLTPEQTAADSDWLAEDPRVLWLEKTLTALKPAKVLVICAHATTAMALEEHLQLRAGIRSAAFHEHLTLIERDRAAAYFAETEQGAQALICSEIGSEGRNFQFAHHLVLFDLPSNPDLLEQRIGRLDRIGQTSTVDIRVPYLQGSAQERQFRWLHEGLNAFEQSCAFGGTVLENVRPAWQQVLDGDEAAADELIKKTRDQAEQLSKELEAGRDALIELNSCRPAEAEQLITSLDEMEQPEQLEGYLLQACDILGVDTEEHSEDALILRPSEHYQAGYLAGLDDDAMTLTWNRQKGLEREDLGFVTWEHPLITGLMDSVIASGLGKASLATIEVKGLKPGTLLLEAVFEVHCPAPDELQLSRYLPPSPVRLLLDMSGRDLSAALSHERLNDLCSNIRRKTAQTIVPRIRDEVDDLVRKAQAQAAKSLPALRDSASGRVGSLLQSEIDRLEALKRLNPAVRDSEIAYFREQRAAALGAIERSELRLAAIRVIITA